MNLAFPKYSRVRNQKTIDECKRDYCEICGVRTGNEPHHIISRGAGGPDIKENLIQLCPKCHSEAHNGKYTKDYLFDIIGRRLKIDRDKIKEIIRKTRGVF